MILSSGTTSIVCRNHTRCSVISAPSSCPECLRSVPQRSQNWKTKKIIVFHDCLDNAKTRSKCYSVLGWTLKKECKENEDKYRLI